MGSINVGLTTRWKSIGTGSLRAREHVTLDEPRLTSTAPASLARSQLYVRYYVDKVAT